MPGADASAPTSAAIGVAHLPYVDPFAFDFLDPEPLPGQHDASACGAIAQAGTCGELDLPNDLRAFEPDMEQLAKWRRLQEEERLLAQRRVELSETIRQQCRDRHLQAALPLALEAAKEAAKAKCAGMSGATGSTFQLEFTLRGGGRVWHSREWVQVGTAVGGVGHADHAVARSAPAYAPSSGADASKRFKPDATADAAAAASAAAVPPAYVAPAATAAPTPSNAHPQNSAQTPSQANSAQLDLERFVGGPWHDRYVAAVTKAYSTPPALVTLEVELDSEFLCKFMDPFLLALCHVRSDTLFTAFRAKLTTARIASLDDTVVVRVSGAYKKSGPKHHCQLCGLKIWDDHLFCPSPTVYASAHKMHMVCAAITLYAGGSCNEVHMEQLKYGETCV